MASKVCSDSQVKSCAKARVQTRLARDLRFLAAHPIDGVAACPLEDNLFVWHANFQLLADAVVHFEIHFPVDYPARPPSVFFATGFPHLNCFAKLAPDGRRMFQLCLNMLGNESDQPTTDEPGSGWSSAYDTHGLLMQVQAFLLDGKVAQQRHNGLTLHQAVLRATKYTCPHCAHSPELVWPPLEVHKKTSPCPLLDMTLRRPLLCGIVPISAEKRRPVCVSVEKEWVPIEEHQGEIAPAPEMLLEAFRSFVVRSAAQSARGTHSCQRGTSSLGLDSENRSACVLQSCARKDTSQKLLWAARLLPRIKHMKLASEAFALAHTKAETSMQAKRAWADARITEVLCQRDACQERLNTLHDDMTHGSSDFSQQQLQATQQRSAALELREVEADGEVAKITAEFVESMLQFHRNALHDVADCRMRRMRACEKTLRQATKLAEMQEAGAELLPEQLLKLDRISDARAAMNEACKHHREALESQLAIGVTEALIYEQLIQSQMRMVECTTLHDLKVIECDGQLEKKISKCELVKCHQKRVYGQQEAALEERVTMAKDAQRKACSVWVCECALFDEALSPLAKAFSNVLEDAVERHNILRDILGRTEDLAGKKAAGKKLTGNQRNMLKHRSEQLAEIQRFEDPGNAQRLMCFESQLLAERTCAEDAFNSSVAVMESLSVADLHEFVSEAHMKESRSLAKLVRQADLLASKKTLTSEERSKVARKHMAEAALQKIYAEAETRRAEAVSEAERVCESHAIRRKVTLSAGYLDALQDSILDNDSMRCTLEAKNSSAECAARALLAAAVERALCNIAKQSVLQQHQHCICRATEAEAEARASALECRRNLEAGYKDFVAELLQKKCALESRWSVHWSQPVTLLNDMSACRTELVKRAQNCAEAGANVSHEIASCHKRLASLAAPDAVTESEELLELHASEKLNLEQELASLEAAMAAFGQEAQEHFAAFQRSYGSSARAGATAAWAELRPAMVRSERSITVETAFAAWQVGMGAECRVCGVLVPKRNLVLHEAHCESTRRWAPKNGEIYLPRVPYQVMVNTLLPFLAHTDLLVLSVVGNRKIAIVAEDGFLWKKELHRLYPQTSLNPANMQDWKYAFMCEMNQAVAGLRCFHSKAAFTDEGVVLGVPISFTVNPKTQLTDYIRSTMDLLSYEAFKFDRVRTTMWREEFTNWLPMYICEEHWLRALPLLQKLVPPLLPSWRSTQFHPEMCLEIFCKAINTLVVLLCDRGEHFSEAAIKAFCMWHRWILRCIEEWPEIGKCAEVRIGNFCRGEQFRSKAKERSMGDFIPLLLVSERFTWSGVVGHLLSEWLDRQILWNCTEHPQLDQVGAKDTLSDDQRVQLSWSAKPVGRRLYAFHSVFLTIFKHGMDSKGAAAQYDLFYGQPSPSCLRQAKHGFSAVMEMESWPHLFKLLRVECPSKAKLAALLRKAVDNSARRKYHTRGMDFQRIHQSGVSKILKKGESYLAAADFKVVQLQDYWAWHGETKFLDATCFVYNASHEKLGHLDYQQLSSHFLGAHLGDVLQHSGDCMNEAKQSGTHTITVDLDRLPSEVHYLYFVLSAWDGKRLNEIMQPNVRLLDEQNAGSELCRYNVEAIKDADKRTSILMCVFHRRVERSSQKCTRWALEAIGDIGDGDARNYGPIEKMIDAFFRKRA